MVDPMDGLARELPDVVKALRELHGAATADGALTPREKQLIIVGISVALRCDPCAERHIAAAREMGISRAEIAEAAGVAVLMGGGPAAAFTCHSVLNRLGG